MPQTATYHCSTPTHGNFDKTTNGNVAPATTLCPICGKPSKLVGNQ